MRKSKSFAALALVASFGLLAAACGDDDEKSDETTADSTATTTGDTTGESRAPTDAP